MCVRAGNVERGCCVAGGGSAPRAWWWNGGLPPCLPRLPLPLSRPSRTNATPTAAARGRDGEDDFYDASSIHPASDDHHRSGSAQAVSPAAPPPGLDHTYTTTGEPSPSTSETHTALAACCLLRWTAARAAWGGGQPTHMRNSILSPSPTQPASLSLRSGSQVMCVHAPGSGPPLALHCPSSNTPSAPPSLALLLLHLCAFVNQAKGGEQRAASSRHIQQHAPYAPPPPGPGLAPHIAALIVQCQRCQVDVPQPARRPTDPGGALRACVTPLSFLSHDDDNDGGGAPWHAAPDPSYLGCSSKPGAQKAPAITATTCRLKCIFFLIERERGVLVKNTNRRGPKPISRSRGDKISLPPLVRMARPTRQSDAQPSASCLP